MSTIGELLTLPLQGAPVVHLGACKLLCIISLLFFQSNDSCFTVFSRPAEPSHVWEVGSLLCIKATASCPSSSIPWDVLAGAEMHGASRGGILQRWSWQAQKAAGPSPGASCCCAAFHSNSPSAGMSAQDAPKGSKSTSYFCGFVTAVGAGAEVLLCWRWFSFTYPVCHSAEVSVPAREVPRSDVTGLLTSSLLNCFSSRIICYSISQQVLPSTGRNVQEAYNS